jgi:hypothetical protein
VRENPNAIENTHPRIKMLEEVGKRKHGHLEVVADLEFILMPYLLGNIENFKGLSIHADLKD